MNWLLSKVAEAVSGRMLGQDLALSGVSTDTRAIAAGQLMFTDAIKKMLHIRQDYVRNGLLSSPPMPNTPTNQSSPLPSPPEMPMGFSNYPSHRADPVDK